MKKNIISFLLAVGIAVSTVPAVMAEEDIMLINEEEIMLISEEEIAVTEPERIPQYLSATATVLEVGEYIHAQAPDAETAEDGLYDFVIDDETLIYDNAGNKLSKDAIEKDVVIRAFYNADKPMVLVYPARIQPEVVIVEKEAAEDELLANVVVDKFEKFEDTEELVSKDFFLRFPVSEELNVVDQAGNKFEGTLEGRDLVVFYTFATMSIPALTNPELVVVLDEEVEEVAVTKVSVNGGEAVELNLSDEVPGMLPVRQVAELMGLEVQWDHVLKAVTVGTVPMGVNFNIGVNSYNKARMMPFVLSDAPTQVIQGEFAVTYVPQDFFTDVLDATLTVEGDTLVITRD